MSRKIKICYSAIFKNESKNVCRCLDALKNIINYVSICDTGSTDNTVELIEKWGKENDIPTAVHSGSDQVFKNFGYNRTLAYRCAIKDFPRADYLLLVDADMVVKISKKFDPNKLTADSYTVEQVNSSLKYSNIRLISTSCEWECVGVTHEYWNSPKKNKTSGKLDEIYIDDIGDGGCKDDKFARDIRLLSSELNKEEVPGDLKGRYMFYLANSYKDSGKHVEAIEWYRKRIAQGGWDGEIFYSYFNIGKCYHKMDKIEKATYSFLEAWNYKPSRAEPLYELSKIYRVKGMNRISMMYAERGSKIKYPENDGLFIEYKVYKYLFLYEISIVGYYLSEEEKQKAKACMIKLYGMKNELDSDTLKSVMSNIKWYNISPKLLAELDQK